MLRLYIGCFGSGLGHAARMLEVADFVSRRGGEVIFSSSNEVTRMIERRGYVCNDLPLADVRYSEEGAFSLKDTMAASPTILARTYKQVYMECKNQISFRPQVVLSDSALPTVLAARLAKLPVYTILNQLNLTSSHSQSRVPAKLLSAGISAGMGILWELSHEILLPDLPPPYTISERNLWGSNVRKTRYIGFLQMPRRGEPDSVAEKFAYDSRRKVFWQVSGPPKTRGPLIEKAIEVSNSLSDRFVFVISAGDPTGSSVAKEIPGGWYYDWCRAPERYFSACDLVVSRAGHGTIGQAIMSSKPSLLVPIPRQPEQEGNAMKAERLGVSVRVSQGVLTVGRALEAMEGLLDSRIAEHVARLGEYALRFDAVEEVVRTLYAAAE